MKTLTSFILGTALLVGSALAAQTSKVSKPAASNAPAAKSAPVKKVAHNKQKAHQDGGKKERYAGHSGCGKEIILTERLLTRAARKDGYRAANLEWQDLFPLRVEIDPVLLQVRDISQVRSLRRAMSDQYVGIWTLARTHA